MKYGVTLLSIPLMLVSCGEREEVVAEETRPLTMRDANLDLDTDNDERFSQGRPAPATTLETPPSPVVASAVPEGWTELESSAFRLLNYSFGSKGQAYVSASRGGVLDNVNRWLRQFGAEPLDAAGLAALEKVETAGYRGVWVEADGDFGGGMGQDPGKGWALRGVVAESGGNILTVKMLGPLAEVVAEEERLRRFVAGLKAAN